VLGRARSQATCFTNCQSLPALPNSFFSSLFFLNRALASTRENTASAMPGVLEPDEDEEEEDESEESDVHGHDVDTSETDSSTKSVRLKLTLSQIRVCAHSAT
jgi:hypothetical protein